MINPQKRKRIKEVYKEVRKITGEITRYCSNEKCKNKVMLTKEEVGKVLMCTKCNQGFFTLSYDKKFEENIKK